MSTAALYEYIFSNITLPKTAKVLDVGCLNANSLVYIKQKYKLTGQLIGIDKSGKNFEDKSVQNQLGAELLEINASMSLPFADNSFDFIFHKDTLECITDIDGHIQDLHRIRKPGGRIVCVHRDWESIIINGQNKKLIGKIIYEYANFLQAGWMDSCDGWIGRRIYGYFNKIGLFDGTIDCYNEIETEFSEGMRRLWICHGNEAFYRRRRLYYTGRI